MTSIRFRPNLESCEDRVTPSATVIHAGSKLIANAVVIPTSPPPPPVKVVVTPTPTPTPPPPGGGM